MATRLAHVPKSDYNYLKNVVLLSPNFMEYSGITRNANKMDSQITFTLARPQLLRREVVV